MKRAKVPRTVITFSSSSDAVAVEMAASQGILFGRSIPVPSQISAGCGMAWCVEMERGDELMGLLEEHGLAYEGRYTIELY